MKVRVSDIPPEGLEIADILPLEALNARMAEGPGNDVFFCFPPQVRLHLFARKGGTEISGSITAKLEQPCTRCLETVSAQFNREIQLFLKPKEDRPGIDRRMNSDEWEDDVGIVYFNGDTIDLEDILQESLILSVSPYDLKHESCLGLSELYSDQEDDEDEESSNKLGALLKRAGVH